MKYLRYTKKIIFVYLSFKFSWVFCILSGNPKLEAWQQKLLWLLQEIHRRAPNKISHWTPMSGQSWSSQRRPFLLLYPRSFPFPSFPHPSWRSLASGWEIEEGRVPGGQDLTYSFPPLQASELEEGNTSNEIEPFDYYLGQTTEHLLFLWCRGTCVWYLPKTACRGGERGKHWSQLGKIMRGRIELLYDYTLLSGAGSQADVLFSYPSLSPMSCCSFVTPVPGVMY